MEPRFFVVTYLLAGPGQSSGLAALLKKEYKGTQIFKSTWILPVFGSTDIKLIRSGIKKYLDANDHLIIIEVRDPKKWVSFGSSLKKRILKASRSAR